MGSSRSKAMIGRQGGRPFTISWSAALGCLRCAPSSLIDRLTPSLEVFYLFERATRRRTFVAVDALKSKKVKKDVFGPEQVVKLARAANGTDWEGAILVGYTTGARLQDVANLRWSALDSDQGLITFQERKGDKPVTVGLHPDLYDWISRQPPSDDPEAYLFPTLANRSGAGRNGLSKAFERIMGKADVAGIELRSRDKKGRSVRSLSFHSFRHGAASAVFNQAALKDITRRVRAHAARGVVDRYIHKDIEAIKAATNLIPRPTERRLMNDNDEENLLAGRITLEQLLLAANVLSAQNPQGQDFDRRRLLEEAHELAEQAREVAFMTAFNRNYRRSERMRYFVKLGYDRLGELEFVPFEQAAVEITGLASRKQAIKRFEKFMKEFPGLRELYAEVHRLGIWRDLMRT
jgi:integrase